MLTPPPVAAQVLSAAVSRTSALYIFGSFLPCQRSKWVGRKDHSDAYGTEETNCDVKWPSSLDLSRRNKSNLMWNH